MRAPMRPDCDELLDASIAHAHQGKFGGREEGVGCHQEKDQKDPEQHKSDHGTVILTFERRRPGVSRLSAVKSQAFRHGTAASPA